MMHPTGDRGLRAVRDVPVSDYPKGRSTQYLVFGIWVIVCNSNYVQYTL